MCKIAAALGQEIACIDAKECKNHLKYRLLLPVTDISLKRARHLFRIESMINVGCKFRPDDLAPEIWDGLIAIARERSMVEKAVRDHRNKKEGGQTPDAAHKVAELRKQTGIPAPGGSIFNTKMK